MKRLLTFLVLTALPACNTLPPDAATLAQKNAASEKTVARHNGGFQGAQPLPLDYEARVAPYSR